MRIRITSLLVTDQQQALKFYTETLGFIKKTELPLGKHKWLTVVSPESDEVELLLEPMEFEPARTYQAALKAAGIPLTAFNVSDMEGEYHRLLSRGVIFSMPPTKFGAVTVCVFDDTCGNNIQLVQV